MLESGSSIDAKCAILAQGYENHLQEKARSKANGEPVTPKLTEQDMQAMIENARKRHADKSQIEDSESG